MQKSMFDILGPVMIGPSSSHTAGAVKLGNVAYMLTGGDIAGVRLVLHGSFARTFKGHGTDKALVAGVLGIKEYDEDIKKSFEIAREKGIAVRFEEEDMGDVHPNTVRIEVTKSKVAQSTITGSSIGGGSILITEINGSRCEFTGEFAAIVIKHTDRLGMIRNITGVLAEHKINIVSLRHSRQAKGDMAITMIETDNAISENALFNIQRLENVFDFQVINKL